MQNSDIIEINAFIGFLCLAGELRINKQSVEELWGTDGDGIENFRVFMSYRHLKSLVRCILNKLRVESIKFSTSFQQKTRIYLTDTCVRIRGVTDGGLTVRVTQGIVMSVPRSFSRVFLWEQSDSSFWLQTVQVQIQ